MERGKIYTIGEIAKICNVSTEQLRHYDKNGILSPQGRVEGNNYRYYTEQQIDNIFIIKELKRVGIPLKTIAKLLKDTNISKIKTILEKNMLIQREELREARQRYDQLVDLLVRLNSSILMLSQFAEQSFDIVPIAQRPIVYTRDTSSYSVDDSFILRYAELLKLIENEKLNASQNLFLLFHDHFDKQFADPAETGDLEVFSNITGAVQHSAQCRMFGGFLAACATHIGHYRHSKRTYQALSEWAEAQGYSVTGVSFQELIISRMMTNHEESYVTKIYLPLDVQDI